MTTLPRWATHSAILGSILFTAIAAIAPVTQTLAAPVLAQTVSYQNRAEQFIDLVFSNQYDEALQYLHPTLRNEFRNNFKERVENFERVTGKFQERQETRVEGNVVLVNTRFANLTDTIVVIFDQDGLITGIDFPIEPLRSL
ncbi:MAG TPA: hypothetical protein V6C57_13300 [Coleofasciculaceae cyanobacterium]